MATWLAIIISLTMTVLFFIFWIAAVLGLPGTWALVIAVALMAWLIPSTSFAAVTWPVVGGLLALALLGELLEFIASVLGVGKLKGSYRAGFLSIVGSLAGAIVGVFVGLPIPIVGSLVAALLFGGLGAGIGAVLGEKWAGRHWEQSVQVGGAAMVGRILGTLGKTVCAAAMLAIAVISVWW